uniref:Uncharacterized protein n=1 Tax=Arundo donax TaxID=35708 RepID=A0A0A8XN04_ARUDO
MNTLRCLMTCASPVLLLSISPCNSLESSTIFVSSSHASSSSSLCSAGTTVSTDEGANASKHLVSTSSEDLVHAFTFSEQISSHGVDALQISDWSSRDLISPTISLDSFFTEMSPPLSNPADSDPLAE